MVGSCVHAHVISPQPRRNLAAISLRPLTTENATECDGVLVLLLESYRCGAPTYPTLIPHHTSPHDRCGGPAYATIVTLPHATNSSLLPTRRAGGGGGDTLPLTVDSLLIATY